MTRKEAYATLEAAGVNLWRCDNKVRIYGEHGSWCYLAAASDGSLSIELGSKSSWRHLDSIVSAIKAALPGVS